MLFLPLYTKEIFFIDIALRQALGHLQKLVTRYRPCNITFRSVLI